MKGVPRPLLHERTNGNPLESRRCSSPASSPGPLPFSPPTASPAPSPSLPKAVRSLPLFSIVTVPCLERVADVRGLVAGCGSQNNGVLCPTGQCCSQYGYCGTTAEFCLTSKRCQSQCVRRPSLFSPSSPLF